jgi:hypothetical protein
MHQAVSPAAAERIAEAMASRFVGAAAYSVIVDIESGDMNSPRALCKFGEVGDLPA